MLTTARINVAQYLKKNIIPIIANWELKLEQYTTVAKLTLCIHNRCLTKFEQKWFPHISCSVANISICNLTLLWMPNVYKYGKLAAAQKGVG